VGRRDFAFNNQISKLQQETDFELQICEFNFEKRLCHICRNPGSSIDPLQISCYFQKDFMNLDRFYILHCKHFVHFECQSKIQVHNVNQPHIEAFNQTNRETFCVECSKVYNFQLTDLEILPFSQQTMFYLSFNIGASVMRHNFLRVVDLEAQLLSELKASQEY